jgi:hypothetical protein
MFSFSKIMASASSLATVSIVAEFLSHRIGAEFFRRRNKRGVRLWGGLGFAGHWAGGWRIGLMTAKLPTAYRA